MTDKQPEALRLADLLMVDNYGAAKTQLEYRAAAELRRLHEVNAELVEALRECTAWMEYLRASGDAGNWKWEADEYTRAIAAIAKATGEQQ
jgi:hypothetical protein